MNLAGSAAKSSTLELAVGNQAAGTALACQGIEHILKLAISTLEIKTPKAGQHEFLPLFNVLADNRDVSNRLKLCGKNRSWSEDWAEETIRSAEDQFMHARYLGFSKHRNFEPPQAAKVLTLASVIVAEIFPEQMEFARIHFGFHA